MPISLCAPTSEITCFGCCPPIRAHHYDPLKYASSLRREFSDNRRQFLQHGPTRRPIVGFSCWALGFLDASGRKVGCLLHPEQNGGEDLRGLINYGQKCQREICNPARVFSTLPEYGSKFWLPLAVGLSSFYFSSPRANPLFHILSWGVEVLEIMRSEAVRNHWTVTELLDRRRFLCSTRWNPKGHRYLFRLLLGKKDPEAASGNRIDERSERIVQLIFASAELHNANLSNSEATFTHRLPMDEDFLDFLRLILGKMTTTPEEAHRIRLRMDELVEEMFLPRKTM